MELSQDLETSSELSFSASEEFKQYQSQRLLHIDALSAKIDQVLTHQHELLALIRHATKSNLSFPIANERELRSAEHNLAKDATPHVNTLQSLLGTQGLVKNLSQVLGPNILKAFNYDGINGKQSFRDFKAVNAAIFDAVKRNGYTEKNFRADMRNSFRRYEIQNYNKPNLIGLRIK